MKDIIKALNNYIKTEFHVDGQFIDTQTYTVDKNFKGFRHYKVGLYYILRGKTIPIIEDNITVKPGFFPPICFIYKKKIN